MDQIKIEIPIEEKIINTFAIVIPKLSDKGKENLLSYEEGMVFALREKEKTEIK